MRIREATEGDATRAASLWTEAYSNQSPHEGRTEPYDEGELGVATATARVLVAESAPGEVIGIVALISAASPDGAVAEVGEAELARLAIANGRRGEGVGRALARRVIALAREEGAQRMALWSRPYQREAHSLYESLGFRRAPDRDQRDPDGRRWVFTVHLEPGPRAGEG
ncbi:MAG: GNAT family N-acetyltransferase [Actinobacteria bacterium]|nr:GNAT family N-acetyltransferase [Actinomycetota bacterium]